MGRLLMFWLPPLVMVAAWQLHHQHTIGAGLAPQGQAITTAAAEIHQRVCR